jgi:hypothetical protein
MSLPEEAVSQLEAAVDQFRARLAPGVIDEAIAVEVEKMRTQFQVQGVDMVRPDEVQRFEMAKRAAMDAQFRADAAKLEQDINNNAVAMTATIDVLSQLPDPVGVVENEPLTDAVGMSLAGAGAWREARKTNTLLLLDRAERKLAGKSADQVLRLYEAAADGDLVQYVIEDQQRRGWPDVQLTAPGDVAGVAAVIALKKAVDRAQRARLEKQQPALVAASARFDKLRGSATLYSLFDHLKSGRGIAVTPKARKLRIG